MTQTVAPAAAPRGWIARSLDVVERVGNRLPDPVVLFLLMLAWLAVTRLPAMARPASTSARSSARAA